PGRRCGEQHAGGGHGVHPRRNAEIRKADQGSQSQGVPMKPIEVAVVGTGWCGGIRAETLASHALVKSLHLAEAKVERLNELKAKLKPATATTDYKELVGRKEIEAVYI